MRDRDLLSAQRRNDPVRGLLVGHAEAGWMDEARKWADVLVIAVVLVLVVGLGF